MGSDNAFGEPFYGEEPKSKKIKDMKIFVLGNTGMLGRYVYAYLKLNDYNVIGLSRKDIDANDIYCEEDLRSILYSYDLKKNDVIINCMGAIKPMVDKYGTLNAIKVNSVFPHYLSNVCEQEGYKMIHITTDCVFSGKRGMYSEDDLHDSTDVYGKTKSLGEPLNCTVMRTSIIGEEIGQGRSLIEWIKSMKDKSANGFINHNWNGMTCLQVAKIFEDIIINNKYWKGVKHIPSPNITNKFELVSTVSDIYELNITVNPVEDKNPIDRTMVSKYNPLDLNFTIPSIKQQIAEMKEFSQILFVIEKCEKCVSCGRITDVPIDMHIDMRKNYVEGAGQLCDDCAKKVYGKE